MSAFLGLSHLPALASDQQSMLQQFAKPAEVYRPRTRWWWPGNVVTKEDISWELRQMHAQGIGGVEQISFDPIYEKGNVPYLSDRYFDLLKHAVAEARSLGMTVSLNFGGPGWIWGADWLAPEERNHNLIASDCVVAGPARISRSLPTEATVNPRDVARSVREIRPDARLVAVVVGRVTGDALDPASLRDVTALVHGRQLDWEAPEGSWRIMAFWSVNPTGSFAVNHLDKRAMKHYVETLGAKLHAELGDALGTTVDSLFGDSFEVPNHRNGIYWADDVPAEFHKLKGYDLIRYLPALWFNVGDVTPRVRYDVNDVLRRMGMDAFFGTFTAWCRAHGVKSRVQPYGFVTDNLEGAGAVDIPEMEITAGEKDAVPWFDTRVGPREYVASGAHIYDRNIVSTEAYTYMHWEPYRATLEELKIASDIFLRAGANRFYNHGFLATPERDITPTRGFYAAIHVSPDNVWWRYYHLLSDYLARSCYLLQQGKPCVDVAVYAPTANQWTKDVFDARSWTRSFEWGDLSRLLLSSGYSFDLVNDDALQRLSSFDRQSLRVGAMRYRLLIIPNVASMPIESLKRIEAYAAQGGVVVALEQTPQASCGMNDRQDEDPQVREIAARLFDRSGRGHGEDGDHPASEHPYGAGATYFIRQVMDRTEPLAGRSSAMDPFVNALRSHVTPDMAIDFVREGMRDNDGLCFRHRTQEQRDIYFVTNVQDRTVDMPVVFRVTGAAPWEWSPYTGRARKLCEYDERGGTTVLPIRLAPFESTFVVFEKGSPRTHVTATSLARIDEIDEKSITGWTDREGAHSVATNNGRVRRADSGQVPAPFRISSTWRLALESPTFKRLETRLENLISWTDMPAAAHFSGTGVYTTEFRLPARYLRADIRLYLDLGAVGNVAEVLLNGKPAGTAWMPGQRLDVSSEAAPGRNRLEIRVTNTLINRVAGLAEFPAVPPNLQSRLGRGMEEATSPAHELLGFKPLPRSGLLGPVELHAFKRVSFAR